mgnify:CR=1 FL=1
MWRILERAAKGDATIKDIDLLSDVTKQIEGHTICAFGEGSAWPVQGLLRHFRKEIDKRCFSEPIIKKKRNLSPPGKGFAEYMEAVLTKILDKTISAGCSGNDNGASTSKITSPSACRSRRRGAIARNR